MTKNLTDNEITSMVTGIRLAADNSLASDDILSSLTEEGYGEDELKAGKALADALSTRHAATSSSLGTQKEATTSTNTSLKAARKGITLFRTKARSVFSEASSPEAWKTLKLDKDIPLDTNGLIEFGYAMVDEAQKNDAILSALTPKGYGTDKLAKIRETIAKAETSNSSQEQKKGVRQGSTNSRDEQLEETARWWNGFKQTARQVLSAEQLTTLGLG